MLEHPLLVSVLCIQLVILAVQLVRRRAPAAAVSNKKQLDNAESAADLPNEPQLNRAKGNQASLTDLSRTLSLVTAEVKSNQASLVSLATTLTAVTEGIKANQASIAGLASVLNYGFKNLYEREQSWLESAYPREGAIYISETGWRKCLALLGSYKGDAHIKFLCEGESCKHRESGVLYLIAHGNWELTDVGAKVCGVAAASLFTSGIHMVVQFAGHGAGHQHAAPILLRMKYVPTPYQLKEFFENLPPALKKVAEPLLLDIPAELVLAKLLELQKSGDEVMEIISRLPLVKNGVQTHILNPGDSGHLYLGSLAESAAKEHRLPLHSGLVRVLTAKHVAGRIQSSCYLWLCDECRKTQMGIHASLQWGDNGPESKPESCVELLNGRSEIRRHDGVDPLIETAKNRDNL